jgi:hypothetical protein
VHYSIGTVTVTRGSATVTGRGTYWTSITSPVYFRLIGDNAPFYTISEVASNTSLTLSVPYGGLTASRVSYMIISDVTTNATIPLVTEDTKNPETFSKKAAIMVERAIIAGD